jgi:formate hydrogenlyase subunit 4
LLAVGSLFLAFGGMDTGSTFGNMGASREMTLTALVEPALITSLLTLGFVAGAWNLDAIMGHFVSVPWYVGAPYAIVTFAGLLFVVLSENARYPVDNPATHLELTMVHEAMILEYSGPYLAMLEYASAIKLTVLSLFLTDLLLPFGVAASVNISALAVGLIALLMKLALAGFVIAAIETMIAKMRFYRMQEYMALAYLTSIAGFVAVLFFFRF